MSTKSEYRAETAARELLDALRDTYGIDIPEEADGEVSNFLCDAFYEGQRDVRERAAARVERLESKRRAEVRRQATSG